LSSQLDQTNPYSSSCIADQSFQVAGQTVTLAWSNFCSALQMVGKAVLAFALLGAVFIVFKG